jgi:hypothetical protein
MFLMEVPIIFLIVNQKQQYNPHAWTTRACRVLGVLVSLRESVRVITMAHGIR